MQFDVINYDVLPDCGSPDCVSDEDCGQSYSVNDAWFSGETVSLTEDMTDGQIIEKLKMEGLIADEVPMSEIEVEGDFVYGLYFNHSTKEFWKPGFELRPQVS